MLQSAPKQAPHPDWGHEVTVKMQGVLEDRTMVEKDSKLVFIIGEGDVNQVETLFQYRSKAGSSRQEHPHGVIK